MSVQFFKGCKLILQGDRQVWKLFYFILLGSALAKTYEKT